MKIRKGFVSNSSSASFICHWKAPEINRDGEKQTVDSALLDLFEILDMDKEVFLKEGIGSVGNSLKRNTEKREDGHMVTKYDISMLNDMMDVPEPMAHLIAALKFREPMFKIIECICDSDHLPDFEY
jgi:hypothetical protein